MARKRFVSPAFFKHHDLYQAEVATGLPLRIGFEALWCQADRRGLFRWKPVELKVECMPYDSVDFEAVLFALEDHGFVECYQVQGKLYGRIPSFPDHQSFHVAEKPDLKIPEPVPGSSKPVRKSGQHSVSTVLAPCLQGASTPVAVAVAVTGTTTGTGTTDVTAPCDTDAAHRPAETARSTAPTTLTLFQQQEAELRAVALPHELLALDLLLDPLGPARFSAVGELHAIASAMPGHEVRGKNTGRAAGPTDVMRALSEMASNAMAWNVPLFRGCVRRLLDRPPEPPSAEDREAKQQAKAIAERANVLIVEERTPAEIEAARAQREAAMAQFKANYPRGQQPTLPDNPPRSAPLPPPRPQKGEKGSEPSRVGDLVAGALRGLKT